MTASQPLRRDGARGLCSTDWLPGGGGLLRPGPRVHAQLYSDTRPREVRLCCCSSLERMHSDSYTADLPDSALQTGLTKWCRWCCSARPATWAARTTTCARTASKRWSRCCCAVTAQLDLTCSKLWSCARPTCATTPTWRSTPSPRTATTPRPSTRTWRCSTRTRRGSKASKTATGTRARTTATTTTFRGRSGARLRRRSLPSFPRGRSCLPLFTPVWGRRSFRASLSGRTP